MQTAVPGRLRVAGDPELVEEPAELDGGLARLLEPDSRLRIEIEAQLVGDVRRSARYGQTWKPRHPRFTAQTTWAMSARTSAREVVPLGVETMVVCSHSGAFSGTRFWKKELPSAPFGKRCISVGRPPARPQERLFDGEVVAHDVELRLPTLREEDLVRARDGDASARDFQLVAVGHG